MSATVLSHYDPQLVAKPTGTHANADRLSRPPLSSSDQDEHLQEPNTFNIRQIEALPVTSVHLKAAPRQDPILSRVLLYTKRGWPQNIPDTLKPYRNRKDELSLEDDCLMWGVRVIVPRKLQEKALQELHQSHAGISLMKAIARSYVWWPRLDQEIENMTKACTQCQALKNSPPVAPLHPWTWPSMPWQRIHTDFAGPFLGRTFLVAIDTHSKWPEVIEMKSTTSTVTIQELRCLFSSCGLPEQLVSDNGPQFLTL